MKEKQTIYNKADFRKKCRSSYINGNDTLIIVDWKACELEDA